MGQDSGGATSIHNGLKADCNSSQYRVIMDDSWRRKGAAVVDVSGTPIAGGVKVQYVHPQGKESKEFVKFPH